MQGFLWAIIGGFGLGVGIRSVFEIGRAEIIFLSLAAGVIASASVRGSSRAASVIAAGIIAMIAGIMRMDAAVLEPVPQLDARIGTQVHLEAVVIAEPDVRESSVRVPVRIDMMEGEVVDGGRAIVVVPLHAPIAYGDRVRVEGRLEVPEAFESSGRVFDYPSFLAKDGIGYIVSFAWVERLSGGEGNRLNAWAIALKQRYAEGLGLALPEPQAGLAAGITVGDKRGLGEDLAEVFRIVGLTHIIVLSGYNIMVVVEAINRLFVHASSLVRVPFGIGIAVFFAMITGFASASTRAALMASIAIMGRATGRIYLASRALAIVAFGMVLWNPYVLMFDPGFQLSIIATAGLLMITPIVSARLTWVSERLGMREIVAASIGTQVAVLPLLLYQTGGLSLVSVPANIATLAVIPFAMLFSGVAGIAGLFMAAVAPIVAFPAYGLLAYVIAMAETFASLPSAMIAIPAFSAWLLIPTYCAMGYAAYRFSKEERGREEALPRE